MQKNEIAICLQGIYVDHNITYITLHLDMTEHDMYGIVWYSDVIGDASVVVAYSCYFIVKMMMALVIV